MGNILAPVATGLIGNLFKKKGGENSPASTGGQAPSGLDINTLLKLYTMFGKDKPKLAPAKTQAELAAEAMQNPFMDQVEQFTGQNDPLYGAMSNIKDTQSRLGADAPDTASELARIKGGGTGFGQQWLDANKANVMSDFQDLLSQGDKLAGAHAAASGVGGGSLMNARALNSQAAAKNAGLALNASQIQNAQQAALDRQAQTENIAKMLGMQGSLSTSKDSNLVNLANAYSGAAQGIGQNVLGAARTGNDAVNTALTSQAHNLDKYKVDSDAWSKMFQAMAAGGGGSIPNVTDPATGKTGLPGFDFFGLNNPNVGPGQKAINGIDAIRGGTDWLADFWNNSGNGVTDAIDWLNMNRPDYDTSTDWLSDDEGAGWL